MKNHSKTYAKVIFALSLLLGLSLGQIHRQYKHIQELENEHFFDVEVPSVYLHSHHHEHHQVNRERLRVQMEELRAHLEAERAELEELVRERELNRVRMQFKDADSGARTIIRIEREE